MKKRKFKLITTLMLLICTFFSICFSAILSKPFLLTSKFTAKETTTSEKPIKWVDFNIPYEVMKRAMDMDIKSYKEKIHVNWVDILAYLGARYGGDFSLYKPSHMDSFVNNIKNGTSLSTITNNMKYFNYYKKAYGAVLNGMLGEYQIKIPDKNTGENTWKKFYGLKAFSPIADGFDYSDFDDFGENRSYGYSRRHLGHDIMIASGSPVIAVESGIIEALGWNRYGGWRIGIRSHDKQRYYYYAHLKKDSPFAENLYIGSQVKAGDVIGYTGQTGYSIKENINNIDKPHLHFGMQLIFDEDSKDSPSQIWIDLYGITRLLSSHRASVIKNNETGQYERKYPFHEDSFYLKEKEAFSETADFQEVQLPIIMYHSLLKDPDKQGKYVVSPDIFEEDLKYIKKKGYTPVFMKDIINYVYGKGSLPKKPIVLTFDDGYYNNYCYAFPLLKKYDMKAVISIVGKLSDDFSNQPDENPNYAHVTWDHVLEMHLSGNWEIQNHSYNCHTYTDRNGVAQTTTESYEDYSQFLTSDLSHLQDKIAYVTGVAPNTFTYPFGSFNKHTDTILKNIGFKATLSCTEGISTIKKGDTEGLYKLKRHLRPPHKSPEEFFTFLQ